MRSLTFKLIIAFLVVSLTGTALVAFFAGRSTASEFHTYLFNQNRENIVSLLEDYYRENGGWTGVEEIFPSAGINLFGGPRGKHDKSGPITLLDNNGQVIIPGQGFDVGDRIPDNDLSRYLPIQVDGREVGKLIVGSSAFRGDWEEATFLDRINRMLVFSALGATAVALLLGVFLARTLTRPLRELTIAIRAVAKGNLERQVPVRSHDELGELAASFNQMNSELAHSRDIRRQMTADIAHELRTPLSVILGHAEAVHDDVLQPSLETFHIIHDEANRLSRLVEDLRTISRAEAGELPLTRYLISPEKLLENALVAHTPRAQQQDVTLYIEAESDLSDIYIDPDRMALVLGNLLANALRYTPAGGQIMLSASRVPNGIEIRVQDSGPGIAPEELPRIFDRFYRVDKSRRKDEGGSGLGLAIAKSIVEGHSGRIWAESKPGEGTTIVIMLSNAEEYTLS